jgi:RND superfamily putative drug exporter
MTHETDVRPVAVTNRIARWSIGHPWWAIGLWLAFVVAAVLAGGMTETKQVTDSDVRGGESGRAAEMIESAGFDEPDTENVLITSDGAWDAAEAEAAAADVADRLGRLPEVAEIGAAMPSPLVDAMLVPVTLSEDVNGDDAVVPVLAELAGVAADHPGLLVEAIGDQSITHGINEVVADDLASAGLLSVPVTLAILLVVFGALVAAGVPLLLSMSAVAAATGLWAFASQLIPDIGTVPQVILLIGLAVGVDYSLFYLRREREERARGHGTVDAVRIAAATSGRAVVVSGLTSVVALAGLFLSGDAIFEALGTGVILAVAVAMIGSVSVLPALLVKLGRAMDRPRVPVLWRLTNRGGGPRVWPALLAPALRAPRTTVVVTVAVLAALALPAFGMSLKNSTAEDLPRTIPVMQSYDRLVEAFPGEGNTHQVVVQAPAAQADAVRSGLVVLAARASGDPLFVPDDSPQVTTSADGTVSTLDLALPYDESAPESEESLTMLRTELLPAALGAIPDVEFAVGGLIAGNVDYTSHQVERMPWVIGFVVLLTVAMMALAFRSIVVAVVAGALTVLSVAAAFGFLTLVFQNTWAEGLLDFTSSGHIVNWIPLFLFVVLFGLSMDYHVFVVSRIREAAAAGLDTRDAVRVGVTRSAGVVTSAAAVMVAVFSIFATLSLIEMKQFGVGLAAAIAIDATVVRILLLPAVMNLLGRANWWPSKLEAREIVATDVGAQAVVGSLR